MLSWKWKFGPNECAVSLFDAVCDIVGETSVDSPVAMALHGEFKILQFCRDSVSIFYHQCMLSPHVMTAVTRLAWGAVEPCPLSLGGGETLTRRVRDS